jgi:hypothetical protein
MGRRDVVSPATINFPDAAASAQRGSGVDATAGGFDGVP